MFYLQIQREKNHHHHRRHQQEQQQQQTNETTPTNALAIMGKEEWSKKEQEVEDSDGKQQNEKKSHYATRSIINLLACKVYSFVELNVISMPKMWYQMNQTTRGWADNTLTMWAVWERERIEWKNNNNNTDWRRRRRWNIRKFAESFTV